jgi:ABC-type amino acid transport substrate-binding protein
LAPAHRSTPPVLPILQSLPTVFTRPAQRAARGAPAGTVALAAAVAVLVGLAAAPARAQAPDTMGKIRAAKQITVAFSGDSLPFSYVAAGNAPAGYSIDLCKRVIAHLGRVAGVADLKVNWVVGTAADRVAMVASGKAELDCANTTATQTRMEKVDFSSLVFVDSGGFAVKADAGIARFGDLAGKRIGVLEGTTTEKRLDAALKDKAMNVRVRRLNDGNEGIALLESGGLDAFASDKIKLIGLTAQARNPRTLTLLPDDLSYEPIAFAVPRGDSAFRLEVNRALTQVYVSGEIERIFAQWLGQLGKPSGLLTAMFLLNAIPE